MLLERDGQMDALSRVVDDLGTTGGKVVLIRGEAGIGKSALVHAFAQAHATDAHTFFGACDDLFIPQPLGPFWDIARTEPSLREPLDDGDRPRLIEAVLGLLSRRGRPTIFIIDDTHWADAATLDAIRTIGRRIARTNGILVLTYRDGDVDQDHPLRGVVGDLPAGDVIRMHLGGLSLSAVASLVGDAELDPADVLTATRGNPFLVREMAATIDGTADSSLHDSLLARLRKLTPGAQELIRTLSVIPEPIPRSDALLLPGAGVQQLDECEQRGFLDETAGRVAFRHDLIRRSVESSLSGGERVARHQMVLERLPEDTHACLLIYCAAEASDIDRLVDLAPVSARYNVAVGSHTEALLDYRLLGPHLDRVDPVAAGLLLDEWAREEFLTDHTADAIRVNEQARAHHRERGDRRAESAALAQGVHYHESAGRRDRAEELAREAVAVLGEHPDGPDLARALEANAYLHMMAGDVTEVIDLVDRIVQLAGPDIDEAILIRSLNHRGIAANIANYPDGRASLDDARERAGAAGQWYEQGRALLNHAWAASEAMDLPIASDYAQRAIASAIRHEQRGLEAYSKALYARVLEHTGRWDEASDLARDVVDGSAITQLIARPIIGAIEARRGRADARVQLVRAWEMAGATGEFQRLAPAACAIAEQAWITGTTDVPVADLRRVIAAGLERGFRWSPGRLAFWLWELGALHEPPEGIAEPYRLVIQGHSAEGAAIWGTLGAPYERALALMHGSHADALEALEVLESLGATAVAARLRRTLRARGVAVPRGRGRATRQHAAGLTARQAEILGLLGEHLTTAEMADRLFISPRTVENHVAAVLDKLDAATRDEAVARGRAQGLLSVTA